MCPIQKNIERLEAWEEMGCWTSEPIYLQAIRNLTFDEMFELAEKGYNDGDHWVQLNGPPEPKYAAFSAADDQPDRRSYA